MLCCLKISCIKWQFDLVSQTWSTNRMLHVDGKRRFHQSIIFFLSKNFSIRNRISKQQSYGILMFATIANNVVDAILYKVTLFDIAISDIFSCLFIRNFSILQNYLNNQTRWFRTVLDFNTQGSTWVLTMWIIESCDQSKNVLIKPKSPIRLLDLHIS